MKTLFSESMRRRPLLSSISPDNATSACPLEQACREHRSWVETLARRHLNDASLAEEVTQDVFLKLSQLPSPPCDAAALRAWLLRCAWYLAANARRKRTRHQKLVAAFAGQQIEDHKQPEYPVETEELDVALATLPALEQSLLLQYFFEGRSHAEIGARHALSAEATRKRITRALRRLHGRLERRGHPLLVAEVASELGVSPSCVTALAGGTALGGATFLTAMTTTKSVALTAAACLGLAVIPWLHQQQRIAALRAQLAVAVPAGAAPPRPPSPPLATEKAPAFPAGWTADMPESLQHVASAWPRIIAAPSGEPNQALIDTLALLLRDPDAARREAAFKMLCGLLREEDLTAVQALFAAEEKRGVLRVPEYSALCFRQGQLLGREALVAKVGDPPLAPLDRLSAALLEGWASREPREAYAWLEQLPEGFAFRTQALQPFFHAALRDHPGIARQMAEEAAAPVARVMLQAMALREIDVGGVEALASWFHALPERENWREARGELAFLVAERQSFASAEAAIHTLQAGWDQPWGGEALAKKIATRFGHVNEGKVLAMLEILPVDSPLAATLADTLFASMAAHQWNVAADFLAQHPEFPHYDRAVVSFVEGIHGHNPEVARAWAATVKDAARREALQQQLEP